ncbi:type IV pilus modification PilV family protein [Thalassotalea profundi]|uniref:Prepilin-type N-terminal cleavage/methylation domain-containing protein n=1 Tax=Thalassotalea profundi TaxID=2036687 RepID=A0ABQ3IEH8_9GAMM|nr:prepilin-type N-terminal cleavage/methylation domain-containing protein [Thalassotalea profundi]GHE80624.1 hypothetical protein GCM10011501_05720 [Thalassotalea profundi]
MLQKTSKRQQGFSLLETIIASLIFAAILAIASLAFKFFITNSTKTSISDEILNETAMLINIRNAIKGTEHYFLPLKKQQLIGSKLFFNGTDNSFTGITARSLGFQSRPTQYRVFVQTNEDDQKSLLYCEYDMKQSYPLLTRNDNCSFTATIADSIDDVSFSYFGYESINDLFGISSLGVEKKKRWKTDWNGENAKILPQYIQVRIEYKEKVAVYKPEQMWFRIPDADPVHLAENSSNHE